jgi:hypothetical protein
VTPWGAAHLDARRLIGVAVCTAVLGVVQPFGLFTVGMVLLTYAIALWVQRRRPPWREIASGAAIGLVGLPFTVNAYLVSTRNPAFASWSAQNQTLSPPPWDYVLSYGIVLALALPGLWAAIRRRRDSDWLIVLWSVGTAALLYAPFSLQRRLVMALIFPLGMLATMGWFTLRLDRRLSARLVIALASLTHVFLIAITLVGAWTGSEVLFMTKDERAALDWLARSAPPDALVIAAPQTGLYIPAWTGRRVYYGHRFDTANAEQRKAQLAAFYRDGEPALLEERAVDYVFDGPRERALGGEAWQPDPGWQPAFRQGEVIIYALSSQ